MGTRICLAFMAHPQSNGQVEQANTLVLQGIKKSFGRLHSYKSAWVVELPGVLWALRTTSNRSTGESSFFLVFGAEAVFPSELKLQSPRVVHFNEGSNYSPMQLDLDILEEAKERATVRSALYQQALRRYHQRSVRSRLSMLATWYSGECKPLRAAIN